MAAMSRTKLAFAFLMVYPFILDFVFYSLNQIHYPNGEAKYNDGECLLKLVNDTDPTSFEKHPLWPYRGYDSECDSVEYGLYQATTNPSELKAMNMYVKTATTLGFGYILRQAYVLSDPALVPTVLIFGWLQGIEKQYETHYSIDLTRMLGALIHHSPDIKERGKSGSVFGESLSHGILPITVMSDFSGSALFVAAHTVVNAAVPGALYPVHYYLAGRFVTHLKIAFQTNYYHPLLHKLGRSPLPGWLAYIVDDYRCHITEHHERDGTCLGVTDFLITNEIYSYLMYVHGYLYETGIVTLGSFSHHLTNYIMEYTLFVIGFAWFLSVLYIGAHVRPSKLGGYLGVSSGSKLKAN